MADRECAPDTATHEQHTRGEKEREKRKSGEIETRIGSVIKMVSERSSPKWVCVWGVERCTTGMFVWGVGLRCFCLFVEMEMEGCFVSKSTACVRLSSVR